MVNHEGLGCQQITRQGDGALSMGIARFVDSSLSTLVEFLPCVSSAAGLSCYVEGHMSAMHSPQLCVLLRTEFTEHSLPALIRAGPSQKGAMYDH